MTITGLPTHCHDCGGEFGYGPGQLRRQVTTNLPDRVWKSLCSACDHARTERYRADLAARLRGGAR